MPPPRARALLRRLLPPEDREVFPAELDELFRMRVERTGRARARWWYRRQIVDLARRRLGGRAVRAMRTVTGILGGFVDMDAIKRDVAYAVRRMLKTPGFTLVAVLSLALGIGANTAMFSVVNAVLFRKPPFRAPEELMEVYTSESAGYLYSTSSQPDARDLRAAASQDGIFQDVVASETFIANAGEPGESQIVFGEAVSATLFDVLGIQPVVGRAFTPDEDDAPGEGAVAVLGYGFWRQTFGGDPGVVGRSLRLNQRDYTIVGVAPEWYTGAFPAFRTGVFVPTSMVDDLHGGSARWDSRGNRGAFLKARLAPGVTAEQAQTWLTRFSAEQATRYPETNQDRVMTLVPSAKVAVHPLVDGALTPVAALLLVVVAIVLLIACTNLAAFLLARAEARRAEIAVRLSLGAGRLVLIRQLLVETVLLAFLGGLGGLLLAHWTVALLVGFRPPIPLPLSLEFPLDGRVLGYTLGISLLAGLLFGLAPALQSTRGELVTTLRADGGRSGGGRGRLRGVLVVAQVALSLVLLVGSGLFLRSLQKAQHIDPGFYTGHAALLWPQMELSGLSEAEARAFYAELERRLEARPEVEAVTYTDVLPLGFSISLSSLDIPDAAVPSARADGVFDVDRAWVADDFFDAMEIPLLRGRGFEPQDAESGEGVAIVSQAFVDHFWPGQEALGRTVTSGSRTVRVVGVARDTKVRSLGEDPRPRIYFDAGQQYLEGVQWIVKGPGPSGELLRMARDEALAMQPNLVFFDQRTMEEQMAVQLFPPRMAALLLSVFGGLALLLAAVGIWGVVSHAVARRTREVGIRVSLGATGGQVVKLLVANGMRLVGMGVVVGLVLAAGAGFLIARFLYGVGALDVATFLGIPTLLVGVALAAALVPARRAARVDPVRALRAE